MPHILIYVNLYPDMYFVHVNILLVLFSAYNTIYNIINRIFSRILSRLINCIKAELFALLVLRETNINVNCNKCCIAIALMVI